MSCRHELLIVSFKGFSDVILNRAAMRHSALMEASLTECPSALGPPVFNKKHPWIPARSSYRGVFEADWWHQWVPNLAPSSSWICPTKLYDLSRSLKYPGLDRISRICKGLRDGFSIGAVGSARLPAEAENWSSVFLHGEQFCDAVQGWLLEGLVVGPLSRDQLPEDIRVSPSAVEIKPLTGAARVCVDMSWPHYPKSEVDLSDTRPTSVNSGIDISQFPVQMVSTKSILTRCLQAGRGSFLAKQDWSDAYKVNIDRYVPTLCKIL